MDALVAPVAGQVRPPIQIGDGCIGRPLATTITQYLCLVLLSTVVPFDRGRRGLCSRKFRLLIHRLGDRVHPRVIAVPNSIRIPFLALSIFGLAANFLGLVYTFAALVNVVLG